MWTVLFFIFERIGVLMQRWRIIVVIGGWMVVALMRIRFTEQVWFGRMTNMWTDMDEDREQEHGLQEQNIFRPRNRQWNI